jgi:hypothetical protein
VISLAALRFGDTWVLDADSGKDSFCPPIGSSNPDAGAAPLLGDSVQIVTPGALEPVVFQDHRATEFVFHDTGLCGVERGVAHDFVTGARTELPPVDQDSYYGAQVFWW